MVRGCRMGMDFPDSFGTIIFTIMQKWAPSTWMEIVSTFKLSLNQRNHGWRAQFKSSRGLWSTIDCKLASPDTSGYISNCCVTTVATHQLGLGLRPLATQTMILCFCKLTVVLISFSNEDLPLHELICSSSWYQINDCRLIFIKPTNYLIHLLWQ